MEYTVQNLSETAVQLTVLLPAEEVQKHLEERYRELRRNVQIPGFRKGKVPRPLLKRRFGKELEAELAQELAEPLLRDALEQSGLRPVGEPELVSLELEEGKPFRLVLELEHLPDFELARYKGLAPPEGKVEVDEAEVAKELRSLQLRHAERTPVDRPAQLGDRVVGRFKLYVNDILEGDPRRPERELDLVIGEDQLFTTSRLDRKLSGHRKGESFRIEGEIPLAYPVKRLQGKPVALEVEFLEVDELRVPELDDALAREHFDKEVSELREDLRRHLEERQRSKDRSRRIEKLFDKLREANPFPLPQVLLQQEIQREEEEWEREGVPEEERRERRQGQRERVEKKVRNGILLHKLIEAEGFEATDEELEERFEAMAPLFGSDSEAARRIYRSSPKLLEGLRNSILEKKALDFLLESTSPLIVEV